MTTVDTLACVDTMASSVDVMSTSRLFDRDPLEMPVMLPSDLSELRARTVAAKLSLPHMGFVLRRTRLHALVEPVRGGGVISLVAGPGCGKTALIVDLLSSASGRTVYFSVDEGDRDPIRFLSYLMAGLGAGLAGRPESRALNWAAPGGMDAAVLDLTAEVVDFISGLAGQSTLVAIDDLHLVESSPQVVSALELIVKGLPPGWTVLLSSRRPLPMRFDSMSLGGRLVRLQSRELRLTPLEVGAWAVRNWSVGLQPSEARALWRLTQGWPAALVLLGQRLLSGGGGVTRKDIVEVIARGSDLRAYLERDIFSGLDDLTAQTMLTAALLPRVMFPRDEGFLPGPPGNAEAVLEDLVSRGFLVTRAGRRSYTVHPLVRGFAEREARQSNEATGLIGRAAQHLEGVGEHHQAASLYLRAGHHREAGRPLRLLTLSSLNAAVNFTRDEWLDLIPDGASIDEAAEPWLLVTKARIFQQQAKYALAADIYERVARVLAAAGDKEGLLPVLLGSAFCLFNQGLWDESLAVMKRCRSLSRSPQEKVEVLVMEGGVLVGLCRWDDAVENWERALALAPAEDRGAVTQRIHFHRARLFYSLGHYRLAKPWVEKAVGNGSGSRTVAHALALNGAAVLACLTGDYEQAGRLADECERLVRTRGYFLAEIPCLLSQASVALGRWDYRGAVMKIREAQLLAAKAGDSEESFWAEDMLGDLCRRNSNAQRALEHHRAALDIVDKNRLAVFERVQAMTAVGMDLAVLGRETEAQASLEEAIRAARRWGLKGSLAPALFYLGWFHARAGREHDAARSLTEAMRIAEEHGHVHFFSQEAKVALPILALCERFGAGSFVCSAIVPLLPERLRAQFQELAEGRSYPTDEPLGFTRRRGMGAQTFVAAGGDHPGSFSAEGIESLTDREREILKMIALGMSNKVIGAKLFISEKTVKTHANHVFRKLGVSSRLQATLAFQSYQRARAAKPAGRRGRR
jgi:ATP/maltotriose-dependent transcriptional regulator MalT